MAAAAEDLVPEAAQELPVALEAGDHEEPLGELGRLRQRVPGAALHPARDDEVARALGSRAGHHRSLYLEEVALVQVAADRLRDRVAQSDVVLHRPAAEVDVAVSEARGLVDGLVVV